MQVDSNVRSTPGFLVVWAFAVVLGVTPARGAAQAGSSGAGIIGGMAPAPTVSQGGSATLLPDGRWLIVGGQIAGEPQARIWTADAAGSKAFPSSLAVPRSGQSATVLPDGSVLVFGGTDSSGKPISSAEIIDPSAGTVRTIQIPGLIARTDHTATLMTDGTVLFVGGVAAGRKLHRYGGRKLHTAIWELRDRSWSGPCTCGSIECCYATTSSRG